jgi:transcriptional repressor NrdR
VRCPWCGAADDRVVDSRELEHGAAIRRRRECLRCLRRFTTYERATEAVVFVLKRSGQREPFQREKVVAGVRAACKNRPVDERAVQELADALEDLARGSGNEVTSERIGLAVLERLRLLDDVASVRFASVYKGFEEAGDFARELAQLEKETAPKRLPRHESGTPERNGRGGGGAASGA